MPSEATNTAEAILQEVDLARDGEVERTLEAKLPIQFNPETLKVTYQVKKANDDQGGGSPVQYTGPGSTKLSVDLIFDVTVGAKAPSTPEMYGKAVGGDAGGGNSKSVNDVRMLTSAVNYFLRPKQKVGREENYAPPGVAFRWGSFYFTGVMDSMNETLEFFSPEGRPLRASVSISITQNKIDPETKTPNGGGSGGGSQSPDEDASAGQRTEQPASREGDTMQDVAARETGDPSNWKGMAAANDIDNPRNLAPGTRLSPVSSGPGASLGVGASAGAGVSGSFGGSFDASFGAEGPSIDLENPDFDVEPPSVGVSGSASAEASASVEFS